VGDTLLFRQFYPDRDVGPSFVLHRGRVIPTSDTTVVLRHDWLSGAGEAVVDTGGRMLAYSGQRSTYKVRVERTSAPPNVDAIASSLIEAERRTGPAQLSVRDTARGRVGPAEITVDYGRPSARGRQLLGNVIEYGRVWRTGANEATQFTTTAPITLGTLEVPAGSYTLWSLPREEGSELIINRQVGQWGTVFDQDQNLGLTPVVASTLPDTVEQFTISVESGVGNTGALVLEWGTFRWQAAIRAR
jgi:hypothetical protein